MRLICNLSPLLPAVVLLVASNLGLAQSARSGPMRQEQEPFAGITQRLNDAADATLTSSLSSSLTTEPGDSNLGTSSAFLAFPAQLTDVPASRRRAAQSLARLDALRWIIEPELARAGLPADLAGLVLVESAALPDALSRKGARGLWQLMPQTARRYGLTVNAERDERLNPEASTRAAATYIRDLQIRFKDWRLVLAAYNAGEDRVQKAIEKAGTSDFERLSAKKLIPEETRNYVSTVLRAIRILREGDRVHLRSLETTRRLFAVPTT